MLDHLLDLATARVVAITPVTQARFAEWLSTQPAPVRGWVDSAGFGGEPGAVCPLPDGQGQVERVLFGLDAADPWCWAHLPLKLPGRNEAVCYRIDDLPDARAAEWAALAWALGCYQFGGYKSRAGRGFPRLLWPEAANRARVGSLVEAIGLVRDLVNRPAADMGPAELEQAARTLAERYGARLRAVVGEDLLAENYPLIHAVGRASDRAPRLIDLVWGDEMAPRVTLVGKGVCFDSGGLDLKSAANMKLMKKDMGGAAHALALAGLVMAAGLPVRLRLLIGAVDNAVSGSAFRPLDILKSRKGLSVEIGNTDAEGRLVLADCLAEADREQPRLLLDFATLTGAARTALGPDLPALFTPDEALAAAFQSAAETTSDPLWRLPLWKPYRRLIEGKLADLSNSSDSPHAGAITAALFLQEFVSPGTPWAHLDLFAWNPSARPGRPEGGEAMALRAAFHLIEQKFPL
ncbi:peptidase B [mine drainage metagenome]|uniref:Peptidase B n=1 Tax=mine drainage metagenome TaxID=410659 RepID=A0A1J5RN47_9ZZZZ